MVLGYFVGLIGLLAPHVQGSPISDDRGLEIAVSFAKRAMFGASNEVHGYRNKLILRKLEKSNDGRYGQYDLGATVVVIDLSNGQVSGFSDSLEELAGDWRPLEALSHEQQLRLAQEIHVFAGNRDPLILYSRTEGQLSSNVPEFELVLLRTFRGVPFTDEHAAEITFEHVTGRVESYVRCQQPLPEPPENLIPQFAAEEAKSTFVGRVFSSFPHVQELHELYPVRLGIWKPNPHPEAYDVNNLTPQQRQMSRENKGILVYWGTFMDRANEPDARNVFKAYFDAQTGQLLAARDGTANGLFGGGSRRKEAAFGWDFGPCRVTVFDGKRTAGVAEASAALTKAPTGPQADVPVTLQIGKMYLNCRYLMPSGLLKIARDRRVTFGKPNPALRNGIVTVLKG